MRSPDEEYVESTGVLNLLLWCACSLHLAARWNVRSFHYDWRKDLEEVAKRLASKLQDKDWIPAGEAVHIVAHGTGGLIAWALRVRHPELWEGPRRWDG